MRQYRVRRLPGMVKYWVQKHWWWGIYTRPTLRSFETVDLAEAWINQELGRRPSGHKDSGYTGKWLT